MDSDALWLIYSYDRKGIQLASDKDAIRSTFDAAGRDKSTFSIFSVKYDIEDEDAAVSKILVRNARIDAAYFHKRPAFKREEEVRALHPTLRGVRVHPQVDDWYASLVERICDKYGIRYMGKSDLYRTVVG